MFVIKKYNKPLNIPKIILIQTNYRTHLCQNHLKHLIQILKNNLLVKCDKNKLINIQVLKKCRSEQYYQKLLSENKIKPFIEEYIKNNSLLSKQFSQLSKNVISIPYPVVTSNTQVYIGSYNLNKNFHGYGVIYDFDDEKNRDSRTEGIFTDGNLNGYGRIFLSSNEILKGDFALNKLNGFGEYIRNDGSIYEGTFFNGHPQGNGREKFNDGSFFEGFYIDGKKKNGKFTFKNGNFYQGCFENDMYDGEGIYKWSDGKIYDGFWKKGKIHGKGKLTFVDGSFYDGYFNEGKKEGNGKYCWNSSNFYDGEWKNDKQEGYGLYYKNGKKARGYWVDGKLINGCSLSTSRTKMSNSNVLKGRYTKNVWYRNDDYGIRLTDKEFDKYKSTDKNHDNYDDMSIKTLKNDNPKIFSNNYYSGVIKPITKKVFNSTNSSVYQESEVEFVNPGDISNNIINKSKNQEETTETK